jgi:hypothetical protein
LPRPVLKTVCWVPHKDSYIYLIKQLISHHAS